MNRIRLTLLLLVCASLAAAEGVDFQRDVRPVLSDACFQCHGPDRETRLAGMRLDTQEGAFAARPNGTPIVPGDPQASLVYQRLTAEEPARRMPPEYAHKEVSAEQVETIRLWIEQGADWSEHWSFRAPEMPEAPAVENEAWVGNPIDRFVLARLEAEGLAPGEEADKRTLARRVSLDLTGLPPSPAEVSAFLADTSSDAYETYIDRQMAKPAYGEHRARYWLDAARYADTHGLHIDNYREMWPYRDWVINAFNQNMGFDQFTIEQLAGDLLPDPTQDQLVATGFQRCNITTNEGGVIDEEVVEIYAKDRAETTATVWMGLTIGCATCHDHKFDPLTQKDFYSLGAFFRNTTQPVRDGNVHDTPPVMVVLSDEDRDRWEALKTEIPGARRALTSLRRTKSKTAFKAAKKVVADLDLGRYDASEVFSLEKFDGADKAEGVELGAGPHNGLPALEVGEEAYVSVDGFDAVSPDKPFTVAAWVKPNGDGRRFIAGQVAYLETDPNEDERGWELEISGGKPAFALVGEREFELGVSTKDSNAGRAKKDEWHHVIASYDGSRRRTGITLYLDGKKLETRTTGRAVHEVEGPVVLASPLMVGGKKNREGEIVDSMDGSISDLRILNREISEGEAALLAGWAELRTTAKDKPKKAREELAAYYLTREDAEYGELDKKLHALTAERRAILKRNPLTHVMNEKKDSEPMANVLYRGMYDQKREEVGAVTPGVLPAMTEEQGNDRMGLAKWLLDERHPLTARVTVNRMWQEVFGAGIVRTSENFGSQGEAPTHPELLDWLAVDFRESGWDMKRFYKQLLMSAAYRQSARTTPAKIEKDPNNRLLSRGPRFRMDGEVVRDYALAASGLLSEEVGGPSVRPYQPEGVWEGVAMRQSNTRYYKADQGDDLYRRSLYTFWKRAAPPASMVTFDAPTRENCTVRRERTNTPLQALVTMNDPQFFEAARRLAEESVEASPELDGRLDFMSARLLARPLESREKTIVAESYKDFLRHYDSTPEDAKSAVTVGASKPDLSPGPAVLAALTMTANQLLNLDEVLNK